MFLFYSLMCRNYQEYKRKPCWSRIGTFLKSVWELFTKIASLTLEDDVIWRPGCYESCHNFPYEDFKPEISPIGVRTRPVGPFWWNPKRGWRKSEKIYKGRKPNSWRTPPPTNFSHQKPRFCLPHGSHLHGGGLPRSHEGGRLRGGAPQACRRRGKEFPAPPRCPSPPSSPPSPTPSPPCIQWFILPQTSVPSYVNMVFDVIIFILWSMSCLCSLFVFRLLCWMSMVH